MRKIGRRLSEMQRRICPSGFVPLQPEKPGREFGPGCTSSNGGSRFVRRRSAMPIAKLKRGVRYFLPFQAAGLWPRVSVWRVHACAFMLSMVFAPALLADQFARLTPVEQLVLRELKAG